MGMLNIFNAKSLLQRLFIVQNFLFLLYLLGFHLIPRLSSPPTTPPPPPQSDDKQERRKKRWQFHCKIRESTWTQQRPSCRYYTYTKKMITQEPLTLTLRKINNEQRLRLPSLIPETPSQEGVEHNGRHGDSSPPLSFRCKSHLELDFFPPSIQC